ncbi:hemolysin family protein [Maritalea mobilis]|uniref:Hemolysin family protein n=1 Tax=[Roseibacterium] beibuensis TaxID=1193142 RepID=A0ABP9L8W9_9RHOB|nr:MULTISPECIES: hemolysin family protein [Alphaproteobacteria]MBY6202088.1 hemolysin family protein [Maritalea mobilis]MCS6624304.1 hemolysin family protein [Roseibacterium beibuensis]
MSSNPDPSSPAARGAQDSEDDTPAQRPGFLARIFGSSSSEDEAEIIDSHEPDPEAQPLGQRSFGMSNLRRMRVEDVAVPRVEIVSVPCDMGLPDLVEVFRESGLTRLPVYDGTLDSPIGMIHLKDVALRYGFNGKATDFSLRKMLRPLLYAPPSMPIGVLLTKMQTERTHMALVIDEYGGVDGIVTIEDLIEQVIGEIEDEHDVEEAQPWTREGDGSFIALARAPLDEFEAEIGLSLTEDEDEEEVDTLGGLVFLLTGRVPARGEVVPHEDTGVEFEVIDADPRRIKRLRVRLPDKRAE